MEAPDLRMRMKLSSTGCWASAQRCARAPSRKSGSCRFVPSASPPDLRSCSQASGSVGGSRALTLIGRRGFWGPILSIFASSLPSPSVSGLFVEGTTCDSAKGLARLALVLDKQTIGCLYLCNFLGVSLERHRRACLDVWSQDGGRRMARHLLHVFYIQTWRIFCLFQR